MPAYDRDHEAVRDALIADGWTVTNDPLHLRYSGDDLYVDLAAERLIAAEKGLQRIAVEIKSFSGPSEIADLHGAVGSSWCIARCWRRSIRSASSFSPCPRACAKRCLNQASRMILAKQIKRLVSFDPVRKVIVRWIP